MRSIGNVERNAAVGDEPPLTAEQFALPAEHRWQRNFSARCRWAAAALRRRPPRYASV
ncbi:hypothetical protein [Actinacidiphila oryziradicis]|uniref:hypothetical protein n=1 Tax=Actinacidiphila oryziradicis TaxID=2571141 RepID=UPI001B808F13|nr:hypothetical protein [Actinacidiphila oryziradicis]